MIPVVICLRSLTFGSAQAYGSAVRAFGPDLFGILRIVISHPFANCAKGWGTRFLWEVVLSPGGAAYLFRFGVAEDRDFPPLRQAQGRLFRKLREKMGHPAFVASVA
jgi:hypothetical protein